MNLRMNYDTRVVRSENKTGYHGEYRLCFDGVWGEWTKVPYSGSSEPIVFVTSGAADEVAGLMARRLLS